MNHPVLFFFFAIYCSLSGAVAVAGIVLFAKHYFLPKPPRPHSLVKLIDLGLDERGLRSETDS